VRAVARDVAALIAGRDPERLTTEHRKAKRRGRIYVDVGRSRYAHTAVAPYAVRPRPGAPVATPLHWQELADRDTRADRWTMGTIGHRLERDGDPWQDLRGAARPLGPARRRLDELLEKI
jgi:bifunctional non-homologous end joining protein LigD